MRRETQIGGGRRQEGQGGFREVLARVVGAILGRGTLYRAGEYPRAPRAELREHGVSEAQVRELAERGLVKETGRGRAVVLTREGLAEAVQLLRRGAVPGAERLVGRGRRGQKRPAWRSADGELWYGGVLVKRYTREAENQRRVLDEFERRKWVRGVDNPLPREPGVEPKVELRRTVEGLNERQVVPLIRFHAEGGKRVRWEAMV